MAPPARRSCSARAPASPGRKTISLQIGGITGHTAKSVDQILGRYLVRTSELAASATAKRLE